MENRKLTLGSLFDGSGGFPLAGILAGIEPRWASEIEPFPIRVTTKRLPQVKHLGDIKVIDGAGIEPVDIVTFGSPCTNLSIAGKRTGLHGEQSSLFFEAIRVIKEMRCATDGKCPRFIVWENVVGAFSSANGRDFQSVLTEIVRIAEPEAPEVPMPETGWPLADVLLGDGWSVAYRVLDAQYFGVAQRRRRIYLVADFDGGCAGKVLFESEGLSGYSAARFRAWQDAARAASDCAGAAGGYLKDCLNDQGGRRMDVTEERTNTLRAQAEHPPIVFENHSQDSRYSGPLSVAPTVSHTYGSGGNNQPLVLGDSKYWDGGNVAGTLTASNAGGQQRMPDKENFQCVVQPYGISSYKSKAMLSKNPKAGIYEAGTARTLDANGGNPDCGQGGIAIVSTVDVRLTSEGTRNARQNVYETDLSRSLDTGGNMPDSNQGGVAIVAAERDEKTGRQPVYAVTAGGYTETIEEAAPTLMARDYKDPISVNQTAFSVRRLMPAECALLQGFPPDWCRGLGTDNPTEEEMAFWRDVFETHRRATGPAKKSKTDRQIRKWLENPYKDSAEYRMWGNGVALPCVWFVLAGIAFFAAEK